MQLRPYQSENKNNINAAWDAGVKNVLSVLPTGGGKTVIFSDVLKDHKGASCAVAHRQELVSQISLALARDDVPHRIIGPKSVIKLCVNLHLQECGMSYFHPSSQCAAAGVDTLIKRERELARWTNSVTKWVMDEGHHVLANNKWGKAVSMFPNAVGLGVTATPLRADGKGLGRHHDGLFDKLIVGPSMRELINLGHLTDYKIYAPKTEDLDLTNVDISKTTGDYNASKLRNAVRKSHIIGDVVSHYLRFANGKLGITFATDVETAGSIAAQFNASGIPAAVVSAKTKDRERIEVLKRFRRRELLQLVNVDLFGEGFDLPAIEVVSMARPTASYGLYVQQFGRACRLLDGKEHAIIIDHVGNVIRHGLPDAPKAWSLDRREKRSSNNVDDGIPVTSCPQCTAVYERIYKVCPSCGFKPEPASRSAPEFVDGDLTELDAETLARMRGEIDWFNRSEESVRIEMDNKFAPEVGVRSAVKHHRLSREMQEGLRMSMAWWGAYQRERGYSDSESYRMFYHLFGIDVLSAQLLKRKDADMLAIKVNKHLGGM